MKQRSLRHLISWNDWKDEEIREILDLAASIKTQRVNYQGYLSNRTLVMLFQKTSTRTRVSFEAAMTEMGGHGIYLDWNTTNFNSLALNIRPVIYPGTFPLLWPG